MDTGADSVNEAEHDSHNLDSLGLSVQAFSMEFDDGANHCSILCNRTSNPAPRPRSTAISDTKMTAGGICSADRSHCGSPSSYLNVHALDLEILQGPAMLVCSETDGFSDVDFHNAKFGLWKPSRSKSVIHRLI